MNFFTSPCVGSWRLLAQGLTEAHHIPYVVTYEDTVIAKSRKFTYTHTAEGELSISTQGEDEPHEVPYFIGVPEVDMIHEVIKHAEWHGHLAEMKYLDGGRYRCA